MPTTASRAFVATLLAALTVAPVLTTRNAIADPTPGFVEHWSGPTTSGWGGGDIYGNPGTGGQLGAGDGFLTIATPGPDPFFSLNLGSTSSDPPYSGNWLAAGITKVKFWLKDIGGADPLEMHFGLGSNTNFWQFDTGFIPATGQWTQFTVDLTSSAGWTRTIGTGTYSAALQSVVRVLIRHDHAPYTQTPDAITADVGVDELTLLAEGGAGVPLGGTGVARAVELAPPSPNPSRGEVTLSMESFDAGEIHVDILDAAGRRIRSASVAGAAGQRSWSWDGRTDDGGLAPAGVYRVRAWGSSGGMSRSLVRLATTR
jgi:hypothetical protein